MAGYSVKRLTPSLASFVLGLLLGFALMQGLGVRERQYADLSAKKWQAEATQWHNEANRLKEEVGRINKTAQPHLYIQNVDVMILRAPVAKSDVIEALSPYTQALLGLPLDSLKAPIVYHLFNNRIITIGTKLYRIRVETLLLGPDTELMISLRPQPGPAVM
ncbi:MAG: hypothetical protein OWR62_09685 [Sulfobacillus thermotolerans]|nr:hypothetical protein [Sulfobacillus thermotolerans]